MRLSCKILGLLLIITICLMFKQSQKETFVNLKDLNIYKSCTINYNKCRRKLRINYKNQYNIINKKIKGTLKGLSLI